MSFLKRLLWVSVINPWGVLVALYKTIKLWLFGAEIVNKPCGTCGGRPSLDLYDGDYICKKCWDEWVPPYDD